MNVLHRALCAAALALPLTAFAASGDVHETTLSNGLKVIVKEDHRAPVVTSQVWYKVGSSYEHNGLTGISHVLEHMMFKGTRKHGPNEFSHLISENGGSENAFTGQDYTAYFQTLEKDRLKLSFELEADRMRNLSLPEVEYKKEIKVVMEERHLRTDDSPHALVHEHFDAVAYTDSPYRHPIIGWMNDLENLTIADVRAWYQRWYAPNNATLVVVGDVEPAAVFKLAQHYFGPLKPSVLPARKAQHDVEQLGARRITVRTPAELPYLTMGYKVPSIKTAQVDWEPYALEMLSGVLDGGDSARFSQYLVRESQIASSVGTGYNLFIGGDDVFTFSGTPADGHTVKELEDAIHAQLERLKTELVNPDELTRIRAQVIASKVYERDSMFYQAMQIGSLETVGLNWRVAEQLLDKIKAVTPQQIQDVARKYFVDDHLTAAVLDPLPMTGKKPRAPSANGGMLR